MIKGWLGQNLQSIFKQRQGSPEYVISLSLLSILSGQPKKELLFHPLQRAFFPVPEEKATGLPTLTALGADHLQHSKQKSYSSPGTRNGEIKVSRARAKDPPTGQVTASPLLTRELQDPIKRSGDRHARQYMFYPCDLSGHRPQRMSE